MFTCGPLIDYMDNGAPWISRSNWTIYESHCLCFVSGARAGKTDQIQLADEEDL